MRAQAGDSSLLSIPSIPSEYKFDPDTERKIAKARAQEARGGNLSRRNRELIALDTERDDAVRAGRKVDAGKGQIEIVAQAIAAAEAVVARMKSEVSMIDAAVKRAELAKAVLDAQIALAKLQTPPPATVPPPAPAPAPAPAIPSVPSVPSIPPPPPESSIDALLAATADKRESIQDLLDKVADDKWAFQRPPDSIDQLMARNAGPGPDDLWPSQQGNNGIDRLMAKMAESEPVKLPGQDAGSIDALLAAIHDNMPMTTGSIPGFPPPQAPPVVNVPPQAPPVVNVPPQAPPTAYSLQPIPLPFPPMPAFALPSPAMGSQELAQQLTTACNILTTISNKLNNTMRVVD